MRKNPTQTASSYPTAKKLWGYWLISMVAWAAQLFLSYSLVEWYCVNSETVSIKKIQAAILAITFVCLTLSTVSTTRAYRVVAIIRAQPESPLKSRNLFMVYGAVLLSGFLSVSILMQGLPNFILPMCNGG